MNKKLLIALVVIVILLIGRIAYVQLNRRVIDGEPPVKSIELYEHWLTVKPIKNAKLSDFVDITFFHGFSPSINFEKAKSLYGNPNNIREEIHSQYYEYYFDDVRIVVGREETSNGEQIGVDWSLYAYPSQKSYDEILSPAISKHVDSNKEKNTIQILHSSGGIQMLVHIIGNRVDHIIWYR